jgi:hypothetical protein
VHFLFNPSVASKISPFARKYHKFREGNLADFEADEKEKFDAYVQRMAAEELDEGETNPVVYEDMPYFHCELTGGINRLAFSTADDPFYKTSVAKYYPEAIVVGQDGTILARVNPNERSSGDFNMSYQDDIRDPVLKINDDRKVQILLGAIKEPGTMILLLVREFDNSGKAPLKEGEFDRAWFRLANEETNQTIDYSLVRKVELPEEYQEFIPVEDDEEAPPFRNEVTYVHGVLYLDSLGGSNKWVFESYKQCFQAKDQKDLPATLASLYARAVAEYTDQQRQLADAGSALKKSLEEKKLQAMEAAKKAKAKAKKKGKGAEEEAPEEIAEVSKADFNQKEEEFDLYVPASFERALQARVPRPFIFGPVEFEGLDLTDENQAFEPE